MNTKKISFGEVCGSCLVKKAPTNSDISVAEILSGVGYSNPMGAAMLNGAIHIALTEQGGCCAYKFS